jgi:uncharacterized protein (TIGR03437 family)
MRLLLSFSLLFTAAQAQSTCPNVHFKNAPLASLTPSTTTRLNLVRQADGSYTSYETSAAAPYSLLSATPYFETQLTACLPANTSAQRPGLPSPANPEGAAAQSQAIALLTSGNYLVVSLNYAVGGIDASTFDPQMIIRSITHISGVGGQLALADLNGDGNPDIVSITGGNLRNAGQLTILLGKGDSSFQAPIVYPIGTSSTQVASFAIGGLNGGKKADIAVAVFPFGVQSGTVMTFLGNGDGTFQPGPSTALTGVPQSISLADLNGDGKLDFAISLSGNIAYALGNGDGTFAPPSYTIALTPAYGTIAIGDMNADGNLDIVTGGTILFGDGKGGFPKRQDYVVSPNNLAVSGSVILTDFNSDGQMDIVIAGGTPALITGPYGSTIRVLFGQPDGSFFAPAASLVPGLALPDSFNTDLRTADFNGDGIPDLVYAGDFGIGTILGKGDGTFAPSFTTSSPLGWYLATGDFDRDGNQDIVALLPYPPAQVGFTFFAGKGDGTFRPPVTTPLQGSPAALVAADFNGDGKLDLAVLFTIENDGIADAVTIYLGNGDGTFRPGASYPTGPVANWMLAGDLNNDGKPDLVITSVGTLAQTGSGNVITLLGKGDGTFVQATKLPLAVLNSEGYAGSMALADFNHDGKLDLCVTVPSGFAILSGRGDGTFQPPVITKLPTTSIAAVDLDGDGIPDLLTLSQVNSAIPQGLYSLLNNGDGTFQPAVPLNIPGSEALLIADVNGDGKPDLVSPYWPFGIFSLLNLTPGPPPFRIVNSASFALGPVTANSFVSAVGTNLPSSIKGLSILVTDTAGVSQSATPLYASSTQINFLMPAGMGTGVATVSMTSPFFRDSLVGQVDIVPIAPGLFTENAAGLAAAYAIRVDAQGNQSYVPIFSVQNGVVTATPIDLGASPDQTYLILFGTGFDTGNVRVTVAGNLLQVIFSGPQGLPGLDQANVFLPHSLAGSGDSPVVLSAAGFSTNTVHITIK